MLKEHFNNNETLKYNPIYHNNIRYIKYCSNTYKGRNGTLFKLNSIIRNIIVNKKYCLSLFKWNGFFSNCSQRKKRDGKDFLVEQIYMQLFCQIPKRSYFIHNIFFVRANFLLTCVKNYLKYQILSIQNLLLAI